jgi:uncharacterized RDD family membrane protein YckC
MDWYYAEGQKQRGPVTEAELEGLLNAGAVRSDTLVWREGMTDWQPYGQIKGVAPAGTMRAGDIVCWQCGKAFSPDEVIHIGEAWVCGTCKPTFVQRLKEGAALPGAVEYAGFWIRFVAKFVDGLILRFVGTLIGLAAGDGLTGLSLGFLVDISYRTGFVGAFGATPGKMAAKLRIVNADGSKISYAKALARSLAEYLSLLTLLVGYVMAAFDIEKRTLHDRICGTRVIKKT